MNESPSSLTLSTPSKPAAHTYGKTTFVAQHLVYAAVMADAGMVSEFVWHAVHRVPRGTPVMRRS